MLLQYNGAQLNVQRKYGLMCRVREMGALNVASSNVLRNAKILNESGLETWFGATSPV